MNRWAGLMPMDTSRFLTKGAGKRMVNVLDGGQRHPYLEPKPKAPAKPERLAEKQMAAKARAKAREAAKAAAKKKRLLEVQRRRDERRAAQARKREIARMADAAVGGLMRRKREAMDVPQGVVAREIGCHRKALNSWESGRESVPKARRERVCAIYGIPLDSWVTACLLFSEKAVSKKAVSA